MGEVQYEERVCPEGFWACVTRAEDLYEQSISMGFMKLMRFICKDNSAGQTPPTQHIGNSPSHRFSTLIIQNWSLPIDSTHLDVIYQRQRTVCKNVKTDIIVCVM